MTALLIAWLIIGLINIFVLLINVALNDFDDGLLVTILSSLLLLVSGPAFYVCFYFKKVRTIEIMERSGAK